MTELVLVFEEHSDGYYYFHAEFTGIGLADDNLALIYAR